MFRNSWNSRGFTAHTWSSARRWSRGFIALLVALVIGTGGRASAAQVAQTGTNAKFYMSLINPKTILCTGETHTYTVVIYGQFRSGGVSDWGKAQPVAGVNVEAYPDPASIGAFYDVQKNGKAGMVHAETDETYDRPVSVDFVFTAGKKPGKGNLTFEGLVKDYGPSVGYVSVPPLSVKVIPCKYKATTLIKHHDEAFNITMTTDEAVMTADAAGNFTGSTSLHYAYSVFGTACGDVSASATDSQVALTGKLDDDGQQFTVTETFGPTTITGSNAGCGAGSSTHQATLDPLTFTIASAGGISMQSVGVGTARTIVTPVEDKAVAFSPYSLAAQVAAPSTWLTELRDDYPRLNYAELGLYP